MGVVRALSGGI